MQRRQFITSGVVAGLGLLGTGAWWLRGAADRSELSLAHLLTQLRALDVNALQSTGSWSLAQIFLHCAQSVDYSMHGYPQQKAEWFKGSVGPGAFSVFVARGAMQHALDEAIPGAPALPDNVSTDVARNRLMTSLETFAGYAAELEPHFAFGRLSKREYEIAHVMHVQNHFDEIKAL